LRPEGISGDHWNFQEKLGSPHLQDDFLIFTASEKFPRDQADAWWLAYETVRFADRELSGSNQILKDRCGVQLSANRIKGVSSSEAFAELVPVENWRPVESKVHVSDVPRIVDSFGGKKLYGDDPLIAVRELIQNGRDAVDARRRRQGRPANWGIVRINQYERDGRRWISVEDDGIGMSERVLTGPLIDFGVSLWSSPLLHEEFPGLAASGISPVGKFGVGFFSAFMLGRFIRVVSRPYDQGEDRSLVLEFRDGLASRPVIYRAASGESPVDGGTRVEIAIDARNVAPGNARVGKIGLRAAVAALAPMSDVTIKVDGVVAVRANDWKKIGAEALCKRYLPFLDNRTSPLPDHISRVMRPLADAKGQIMGRACIHHSSEFSPLAVATIGGMSAAGVINIVGLLKGEAATVARDEATINYDPNRLSEWATEQGKLLKKERLEPETEAKIAEIIIECGGDPSKLFIARLGQDWHTQQSLAKILPDLQRLTVHFGRIDREDGDVFSEGALQAAFKPSAGLLIIEREDGRIRAAKRKRMWLEYDYKTTPNNLEALFRRIIAKAWKDFEEEDEFMEVGTVHGVDVIRGVTNFVRL
jgi:hypothetical protein